MQEAPSTASPQQEAQPAAIESASASTACQTNASPFAYVLTAATFGAVAILMMVLALFTFSFSSVSTDLGAGTDVYGDNGYEYYFDDQSDDWGDDMETAPDTGDGYAAEL